MESTRERTTDEEAAAMRLYDCARRHFASRTPSAVVRHPASERFDDDGVTPETYPAVPVPYAAMKIAHGWVREHQELVAEYSADGNEAKAAEIRADFAIDFFDAAITDISVAIYGALGGVCRSCSAVWLIPADDVERGRFSACCGSDLEWSRPLGLYLEAQGHEIGLVASAEVSS